MRIVKEIYEELSKGIRKEDADVFYTMPHLWG